MVGYLIKKLVTNDKPCQVVLAVPSTKENKQFEVRANDLNCSYFAGNECDVLSRYYECSLAFSLDTIVRLTSDNPFVPAHLVFEMINTFNNDHSIDYLSTTLDTNNPIGLHIEVFSRQALEKANSYSSDYPLAREHVTPYIYNNRHLFNCRPYSLSLRSCTHRLTVDYDEDLHFARRLANRLSHIPDPSVYQIIRAIEDPPSLSHINSMHKKLSTSPLK